MALWGFVSMIDSRVAMSVASAALIAAGTALVIRDLRTARLRTVSNSAADTSSPTAEDQAAAPLAIIDGEMAEEAVVTIIDHDLPSPATIVTTPTALMVHAVDSLQQKEPTTRPTSTSLTDLKAAIAEITNESVVGVQYRGDELPRDAGLAARWSLLEPAITRAVGSLNLALAPIEAHLGEFGTIGWSFKNVSFGGFRRVTVLARSVAWLRVELDRNGDLVFKVRAHSDEHAPLNATSSLPAGAAHDAGITHALATCLRPVGEYASWIVPKRLSEAEQAREAWPEIAHIATDAVIVANSALSEANASLRPLSDAHWDHDAVCHRWALSIDSDGAAIGTLHIDLDLSKTGRCLNLTALSFDPNRIDLTRRRHIEETAMAVHTLAEQVANCVWPAIADALSRQADAGLPAR